jgi:hypothetical protein
VEPADVGVQFVFRHHPLGAADAQVPGWVARSRVISRVLAAADLLQGDLADLRTDAGELDHAVVQSGITVSGRCGRSSMRCTTAASGLGGDGIDLGAIAALEACAPLSVALASDITGLLHAIGFRSEPAVPCGGENCYYRLQYHTFTL